MTGWGVDSHWIGRQLSKLGAFPQVYDVIGRVVQLRRDEYLLLAECGDPPVPGVHVHVPPVVIVFYEGKRSYIFRPADRIQSPQLFAKVAHFGQLSVVPVVIVQDAVPVDLRAKCTGAPAEKGNKVRSLKIPETQHDLLGNKTRRSRS